MYHVRTQIFLKPINATDIKLFPVKLQNGPTHSYIFLVRIPWKHLLSICIFGDSRKSKKSAIWLICLHSDMLSIWQNSIQAFAKIIKP